MLKTTFSHRTIEPFFNQGIPSFTSSSTINDELILTINDQDVFLMNLKTGFKICDFKGDGEEITFINLTPDGKYVIICSRSYQMFIYKVNYEENKSHLVKKLKAHDSSILVCAIDSSSSLLATGGADGIIKVWDIEGGFVTHNFHGHKGLISALEFYQIDNEEEGLKIGLVSSDDSFQVRVWDLIKRKCIVVNDDSHDGVIRSFKFSKNCSKMISGGRDQIIQIWDTTSINKKKWKILKTLPILESIESCGFLNDNEDIIYTGGEDCQVKLWSLSNGKLLASTIKKFKTNEEINIVNIYKVPSLKTTRLYVTLSDQRIWELEIFKNDNDNYEIKLIRNISGNHGNIIDCKLVSKNLSKIALATTSTEIEIINYKNDHTNEDTSTSINDIDILQGHEDIILSLDTTINGYWLASAGKDNKAILWKLDLKTNKFICYAIFIGHAGSISGIGLSKLPLIDDEIPKFLITGSDDLTIKKWKIPNPYSKKNKNKEENFELPFIVKASEYTRKIHEKEINSIDISPNDTLIASASFDKTCKILDIETGETIGILKGHKRGIWSVKFCQYDKLIITGSADKTIKLWDLNNFQCLKTFQGHSNSILKLSFINSNKQIVSCGGDGLVKIWDLKEDECITTLDNHESKVWSLSVINDGEEIISADGDGVITIWKDNTEEQVKLDEEQEKEMIEQRQHLDNFVNKQDWKNAILLALKLNHPYKLFQIFQQVLVEGKEEVLEDIVVNLSIEELTILLGRIKDWSTSWKSSLIARKLISLVLNKIPIDRVLQVAGISGMLDSIVPYLEKHFGRADELLEQTYILDYLMYT